MDIIALLIEFVKAQGYTSSFCRNLLSCILTVMVFNLEPTISRIALFLPVNAELRHRRKHLQRFLLMLDERIFKVLFKLVLHVLGKPSRIVVAIDWTQIGKRYLFLAAITIDGRTLPIAFLLRENKSVQDKKEMVSLIGVYGKMEIHRTDKYVDINSKIRKTPVENVKKHREKLWTNI